MNWEKGYFEPEIRYFPAIISFLGYDPFPNPKTLDEKIVAWRRRSGISRKSLARQLSIDEASLAKREKDILSTPEKKTVKLTEFLHQRFVNVSGYHT